MNTIASDMTLYFGKLNCSPISRTNTKHKRVEENKFILMPYSSLFTIYLCTVLWKVFPPHKQQQTSMKKRCKKSKHKENEKRTTL